MATLSKSSSRKKRSKSRRTTVGDTLQTYGPLLNLLSAGLGFADIHFDVLRAWCDRVASLLGLQ